MRRALGAAFAALLASCALRAAPGPPRPAAKAAPASRTENVAPARRTENVASAKAPMMRPIVEAESPTREP